MPLHWPTDWWVNTDMPSIRSVSYETMGFEGKFVMNILQRVRLSVSRRKDDVFVRDDFSRFGSAAQVSRALRQLLGEGRMVRLGVGIYAKAKKSVLTGQPIPVRPVEMLAPVALKKLGVNTQPSRHVQDYNSGSTTQLPGGIVLNTGTRRVSRRIGFGGRYVEYENNYS